jgi:hypothetical protein
MAKTGKQVQGDIYKLLRDSTLYTQISGEVYRYGYRPRDSRKEDATVRFTTGIPEQIQTGAVTVNIFVPDIDPDDNGTWVEDGARTERVERLAQAWVDSLTAEVSCYRFELEQTIDTYEEPEIHQHFVCVKLKYRYFGDDDAPVKTPQDAMIDASDNDGDDSYLPLLQTEEGDEVVITPVIEKR